MPRGHPVGPCLEVADARGGRGRPSATSRRHLERHGRDGGSFERSSGRVEMGVRIGRDLQRPGLAGDQDPAEALGAADPAVNTSYRPPRSGEIRRRPGAPAARGAGASSRCPAPSTSTVRTAASPAGTVAGSSRPRTEYEPTAPVKEGGAPSGHREHDEADGIALDLPSSPARRAAPAGSRTRAVAGGIRSPGGHGEEGALEALDLVDVAPSSGDGRCRRPGSRRPRTRTGLGGSYCGARRRRNRTSWENMASAWSVTCSPT
jgi:hypothetical protein